MGRKTRVSKGKQMKPNFFVFCEGETEMEYVRFLRSIYRVPIQVIPRKSKSNISTGEIERTRRDYVETNQDKVFLMFDLDVDMILEHLQEIPDAILLVSNPCIELWFLLHFQDQKSRITSDKCIQKLMKVSPEYKKGEVSHGEKEIFSRNVNFAIERAKRLNEYENPSTTVYRLIEMLNQFL